MEPIETPKGHKPHFNTKVLVCVNRVIYLPHAGVTLRRLIEFASDHYHGGSRYFEVHYNGVFLAKVAVPKNYERKEKSLEELHN